MFFAKYVVLGTDEGEKAVLLPPGARHKDALFMFGTHSSGIISAGYVEITSEADVSVFNCYGECDDGPGTLIKSRHSVDEVLLEQIFKYQCT